MLSEFSRGLGVFSLLESLQAYIGLQCTHS